jgi:hypothetical protein
VHPTSHWILVWLPFVASYDGRCWLFWASQDLPAPIADAPECVLDATVCHYDSNPGCVLDATVSHYDGNPGCVKRCPLATEDPPKAVEGALLPIGVGLEAPSRFHGRKEPKKI